jgi:hypothetical protein
LYNEKNLLNISILGFGVVKHTVRIPTIIAILVKKNEIKATLQDSLIFQLFLVLITEDVD